MNQIVQEKEQELSFLRADIPKKERAHEESLRAGRQKMEGQIKSLEGEIEGLRQQIERMSYELQVK